ncbi:NADH-quinone oxidoreductase subunit NuoK [Thalassomonas sp. M1454]|uniref:NADH-quinone oxidoreductase subunit NuoK n=1 Tax=Thalassomonas sp. M1454 TaxID=2594477 RepID=UPI00117FFA23|nr:NADH-quinone oxidoreductase subunit NuoK [Thalassomonas sp. M1454]TRX55751.1 NADH-quinone oxidoreductase subunit NuoK [Thalassomonas sp. M1454]
MSQIPLNHVFIFAIILFVIGFIGVIARRNTLFMLMSLEVMLNAVGLAFIGAGSAWVEADGQVMFILILTLAAAEVAVGLALLIRLQQQRQCLDIDALNELRE